MVNKINLAAMGLTMMLVFGACSLLGNDQTAFCTAAQTVQEQKSAIEAAAITVVTLHSTGKISDAVYTQAQTAYGKWAAVQKTAVDGLVTWNDAGASPNYASIVAAILVNMATLYTDFQNVYVTINGVPPMAPAIQATAAESSCTYTDAQLMSMYADPWSALAPVSRKHHKH